MTVSIQQINRRFPTLNESHRPLNADCCEVDHAGQGGDHLYVANDLADGGGLKHSQSSRSILMLGWQWCEYLIHGGVHLSPDVQGEVDQQEQEVSHGERSQKQGGVVISETLPPVQLESRPPCMQIDDF